MDFQEVIPSSEQGGEMWCGAEPLSREEGEKTGPVDRGPSPIQPSSGRLGAQPACARAQQGSC
jgi:hypothetical protein